MELGFPIRNKNLLARLKQILDVYLADTAKSWYQRTDGTYSRPDQRNPKTESQVKTLEALSETLIPADEHSPGAKAARVWEYIDAIIVDADESAKSLWTQGLAAVDKLAEREYQKAFADCAPDEQVALVEKIAQNEEHPSTPEERFFVAAKRATVDGYYTSAIGIHQDLEYQGNTAVAEFPGCTHAEHKG